MNATRAATPSTAPRIHPRPSTARPANAAHDLVHDIIPRRPSLVLAVGSSRRAGARRRGQSAGVEDAAAADDEPDWLREYERGKRGRDHADRAKRRAERRAEARKLAADADRAFFAKHLGGGGSRLVSVAGSDGRRADGATTREAAATAAYAAALARGATRDSALEEAEFLADEWTSDGEGVGKRSRAGSRSFADDPFFREDDSDSDSDPSRSKARSRYARRLGAGRARDSDAEDESAAPQQIIFCSRTHSQLTQVVGELNSTRFGGAEGTVSAVAVAGRRQLCVNPAALAVGTTAARLNERCLELGKRKGGGKRAKKNDGTDGTDGSTSKNASSGCPFLRRRRGAVEDLAEAALATPMDIEDLAAAGVRHRACPYYAARKALPRADLVFAPYASVLQRETRESLGVRLEGAVVVFDEAHNLVEAVHGAHGATLTGRQVGAVRAMVSAYVDRFRSRLAPGNLRNLRTLVALAAAFERALSSGDARRNLSSDAPGAIPTIFGEIRTLNDFLFACGADNVNVFALAAVPPRIEGGA